MSFYYKLVVGYLTANTQQAKISLELQNSMLSADLPGDFADLALVAISEKLDIPAIATLDRDFDIYRRYRKQHERASVSS